MTADEAIKSIRRQIKSVKQSLEKVKSENEDYLTGYLSALSTVEGMIEEVRPENITIMGYLKSKGGSNA